VTDAGLKELIGLARLRSLDLGHTQVTRAGLSELNALRQLQMLTLAGPTITDLDVGALAGVRSLKTLRLDLTKVTDQGVRKLQQKLPGINIEVLGGKLFGVGNDIKQVHPQNGAAAERGKKGTFCFFISPRVYLLPDKGDDDETSATFLAVDRPQAGRG
jgi:hypothetical protein